MICKEGIKACIDCSYANTVTNTDLDIVRIKYEPTYDNPNCHYCEHCYDNIENYG